MTTQQDPMVAHGHRVAHMAADPELNGKLLAVGIAMSAIIDGKLDDKLTLRRINNLAFGPASSPNITVMGRSTPTWRRGQAVRYIEKDIRRYAPPEPVGECGSPTPRKARCGRNTQQATYITDWATGERIHLAACSKHIEWFERTLRENHEAKPEVGGPRPYANTGGVLARHFPEVDWHGLWSKVDSKWQPFPEREPVEPSAPTLTVLTEEPPKKTAKPRSSKPAQRGRARGPLHAIPDLPD